MPKQSKKIADPKPTRYRALPKKLRLLKAENVKHGFAQRIKMDSARDQVSNPVYCGVLDNGQSTSVEVTQNNYRLVLSSDTIPNKKAKPRSRINSRSSSTSEIALTRSMPQPTSSNSLPVPSNHCPDWESQDQMPFYPPSDFLDNPAASNGYLPSRIDVQAINWQYFDCPSYQSPYANQIDVPQHINRSQSLPSNMAFQTAISAPYHFQPSLSSPPSFITQQNTLLLPDSSSADISFHEQMERSNTHPPHDGFQFYSEPEPLDSIYLSQLLSTPSDFNETLAPWSGSDGLAFDPQNSVNRPQYALYDAQYNYSYYPI